MSAAELEAAMRELLFPDTQRVKAATTFIVLRLKHPQSLIVLLQLAQGSSWRGCEGGGGRNLIC